MRANERANERIAQYSRTNYTLVNFGRVIVPVCVCVCVCVRVSVSVGVSLSLDIAAPRSR